MEGLQSIEDTVREALVVDDGPVGEELVAVERAGEIDDGLLQLIVSMARGKPKQLDRTFRQAHIEQEGVLAADLRGFVDGDQEIGFPGAYVDGPQLSDLGCRPLGHGGEDAAAHVFAVAVESPVGDVPVERQDTSHGDQPEGGVDDKHGEDAADGTQRGNQARDAEGGAKADQAKVLSMSRTVLMVA